jgi:3-oxoacyl-[acyl-carrier-protein] synthase II
VGECHRIDDSLLAGVSGGGLDRSIRIALAAVRQVTGGRRLPADTRLFCGTSKGPVTTLLRASDAVRRGEPLDPLTARQVALGVGAMGTLVAEALGLEAGSTSVAACASGLHAVHRAAEALWRGECSRALVVAADASLHDLFQASFRRLGVLSPAGTCTPFGESGEGFFITEAGAALLLEAAPSGHPPLAHLSGSWIGADGTGLVAIDPQTTSLRRGLAACAAAGGVSFVHAHATGTGHDRYELEAIRAAVGGGNVPTFSSKGHLGHSLGAAGLVSLVLSAISHARGETFLGYPVLPRDGAASLTVAQGFGGAIGVVRLQGR